MKYKLLINGQNLNLTKDFFYHTQSQFQCLSTSSYWNDITTHFELFKPDAYICFFNSLGSENVNHLYKLKDSDFIGDTKIITILHNDIAVEFEKKHPVLADLIIKYPVSVDNMSLKITRFFDNLNELQAQEYAQQEKAKREAERKKLSQIDLTNVDARKSILIVDDDRNILKLLKTALSEFYHVTTLASGVLVEKFFETKTTDLIILDYEMPVISGAEVFRRLKANEKSKDIPVCFLTGVNDKQKIYEIMLMKPHGYLLKPINMEMLLSTISNLID